MVSLDGINEATPNTQLIANDFDDFEPNCFKKLRTHFLTLSFLFLVCLLIILNKDTSLILLLVKSVSIVLV